MRLGNIILVIVGTMFLTIMLLWSVVNNTTTWSYKGAYEYLSSKGKLTISRDTLYYTSHDSVESIMEIEAIQKLQEVLILTSKKHKDEH